MQIDLVPFAKVVLTVLTAKSVLLPLVNNTSDVTIPGGVGQPIQVFQDPLTNVTVKDQSFANDQANVAYTFDRLLSSSTNITLNDMTYVAVQASVFDTLEFTADNLPNYSAWYNNLGAKLASGIDTKIAALFDAVTTGAPVVLTATLADIKGQGEQIINDLEATLDILDANGVPDDNRVIVVGSKVNAAIRSIIQTYLFTGDDNATALRQNIVGVIGNAPVVKSAKVAANSAVVYQKDAFVVATRPAGKLQTAKYSEVITDPSSSIAITVNLVNLAEFMADGLHLGTFSAIEDIDSTHRAVRKLYTFPTV
jgi:hypothetical protein